MNTRDKIILGFIFFILSSFFSVEAQETFATITISGKSFPDASSGGSLSGRNLKIQGLYVYVNEKYIGFLSANDLNTSGETTITTQISVTDSIVTPRFIVYYRYYRWPGYSPVYYYKTFYGPQINDLYTDGRGLTEPRLFNSFSGMELSVNWSMYYKVEVSPFKPAISSIGEKKCYNLPFWVKMDPYSKDFYNRVYSVYDWEYGLISNDLVRSQEFNDYLNKITSSLNYRCQSCPDINQNNINTAIINTDYGYMKNYLYLYGDLPGSKESVAELLLQGIINQNTSSLTQAEITFLYDYFPAEVKYITACPAPYLYETSIKEWLTLEKGKSKTDSVEFIPGNHLAELSYKARVNFRVKPRKIYSGKDGPLSEPAIADILPAPPMANSITSTLSCINNPTAEIKLSDVRSPVNTSLYTYRILNGDMSCLSDILADPPIDFNGSEIAIKSINPGSYNLCLTYQSSDLHNCFAAQPITVGSLPKLNFQISGKDVSCPGGSDGSINVKLSSWAGDFQIIANGATVKNNPDYTFEGLAKANYPVSVTDFCYNEAPVFKPINQPDQVVLTSVISKDPTCLLNPNGGFKVTAAGGTKGRYDYYVYKANDFPSGSPLLFYAAQGSVWENYNLPAGSYVIRVRDNDRPSCDGAISSLKMLQAVVPLDLTTNRIKKVKCYGESTGEIEVSASGGSGNYKFNIDSYSLTSNPAVFSSLKALNYTVILHNSDQSCTDVVSETLTVETNPLLGATLTPKDANCFGSKDGQVNTSITGGSGNYNSFSWEQKINGSWFPNTSSTASPANFYAGEYRLKVSDSEGCSLYASTIINEPALLEITALSFHDPVCYGNTGSIDVTATGGNGGYLFLSSETHGASFTGFTSGANFIEGSYLVKVRDSKGCEAMWEEYGEEKEIRITGPVSPLNIAVTPSNFNGFNISGYGINDGSLTLKASGGNGERGTGGTYSGYIYSLSGRSDQTSGVYSNLGAGEYAVKVIDERGCSFSKSVTLTQPDILSLSVLALEAVKCNGSATGKITVSASGGVSPYTYQRNSTGFVSSNVFGSLLPGTHQITVKDRNGYTQTISETVVNKNEQIKITLLPQDVKCYGENNGQISTTITGGSGGFVYFWQKWLTGSWQTYGSGLQNINQLGPGKYKLRITDSDNCSAYDSTVISQPTQLTVTSVVAHDIICFGTNGSIDIAAGGSKGGYKFSYALSEGGTYTEFASGSSLSAASYKLKVTDSNGCNALWNNDVKITSPAAALNFTTTLSDYNGYNISCYGMSDGSIIVSATGGNGNKGIGGTYSGYSYSFSGGVAKPEGVYTNLIS
jgi:hypothetical protein